MSEAYAREILRRNIAQICQTIGWNGINSSPLDILVHVLEKYIRTLGTQTNRYAEQFNRTEPNLHDLGLVFRDFHIQLPELTEYTRSVPPVPPPNCEQFPKPKDSNLNFLKPGSHEVVTRPMYVHEHLPPMYPEKERDTPVVADTIEIRQNGIDNTETNNTTCTSPEISVTDCPDKSKEIFKRPIDPISLPNSKRPRLRLDEEERTREISSVMMTMSGFLSPAREGKLPEARPPTIISERHYDKHKANSHHSNVPKLPILDKADKKSKKNKLLNGKIMKSKRKDKSHKGESSKSKDISKLDKCPPGYPSKNKDIHPTHHNHVTMPAPKVASLSPKPAMPLPLTLMPPVIESIKPVIKQEHLLQQPAGQTVNKSVFQGEDTIPVPRKIPISKSPLISNSLPTQKQFTATNSIIPEMQIKKEIIDEEEKLASQPDRSKINIFKRISNKSKEDRTIEVVDKSSDAMISRLQNSAPSNTNENMTQESDRNNKVEESIVNNNDNSAVDLSMQMDLRANEVIDIDDDSLEFPLQNSKQLHLEPRPNIATNKSLQVPFPKDATSLSPKIKKEKKHKEKKCKAAEKVAKLEAKLLKKQQQQLAYELAQEIEKQNSKMTSFKPPKANKQRSESKLPQLPPGFPFFPTMHPGSGLMTAPGLIPNPGLIPGADILAGLANNPALRGVSNSNLLSNPFALGAGGPGLIPGPSFLPGGLGAGLPNRLLTLGNYTPSPRSTSSKIPTMLRRPSLEVIPVDNDEDRTVHKSSMISREKDRHDKHKSNTIPNILQKHKSKSHKEHKTNLFKMPPIHPDITIELNPPRVDSVKLEMPKPPPVPVHSPTPDPQIVKPIVELHPEATPTPQAPLHVNSEVKEENITEKRKDKGHKKEKKDKDGIKIKKKKAKKDKTKDKTEKKKDKEDKQEIKDRIKKEKKEKKKVKTTGDGLVPKLTLKLGSSNSNSPMPPSSPVSFKLNIKPVIKKEKEEESSLKDEIISREHSHSPELAQISPLVMRPPKQKLVSESEGPPSRPSSDNSPPRKNHSPSSHAKYKRILSVKKPLSKKGHIEQFDDNVMSVSEEAGQPIPSSMEKQSGPLPAPYYLDGQQNHVSSETVSSSSGNSPPRKNHSPSSLVKYKRILPLKKPLSKKVHVEQFDDDVASVSEGPGLPVAISTEKHSGPLPTPYYLDGHGNKIWVCPACSKPDNGSPMIGCDGCDCWYHWVCVGITEEPRASEDWFCKSCIAKRPAIDLAGVTQSGKKRGRKPKTERMRDCH